MMQIERTVARLLFKAKKTVAVAESCTGGLISHRLTNISGSSKYFRLGLVAYSNEAKIMLLGVSKKVLKSSGAVSKEVAIAMAKGARRVARSDIGLGVTGIAGPSGATKNKPVGMVFIALNTAKGSYCEEFKFCGTRLQIKNIASTTALRILKREAQLLHASDKRLMEKLKSGHCDAKRMKGRFLN